MRGVAEGERLKRNLHNEAAKVAPRFHNIFENEKNGSE
jgi:hypothetical protein